MPRRLHQTLADYVVIAISPALIMLLVGSLVYFLLAIVYQGGYQERLHWVMACFVFAAVLIGRISIEEGFERAVLFGAPLAILMGFAAHEFIEVQGSGIDNIGWLVSYSLIALVWWCAHKLTWDCTLIDDEQDASGEGLMQLTGLERPADARDAEAEGALEGTTSREVPASFWQRYVQHQRRPHAPGVWVVYFSLAALPIFGFGQWFIPATNAAARRYVFWLLCIYVASGLGLLVTTSFLGLRRYLRQRRIEMPTLMANLWLGTGVAIILALLVAAALLPRPRAEFAIAQLPFTVGSPDPKASKAAPVRQDGTEDDEQGPAAEADDERTSDRPPQGEGNQPEGQAEGEDAAAAKSGDSPSNSDDDQGEASREGRQSDQDSQSQGQGKRSQQQSSDNQDQAEGDQQETRDSDAEPSQGSESDEQQPSSVSDTADDSQSASGTESNEFFSPPELPPISPALSIVRWAVYALVVLIVAYALWRYWRDVLAAIRNFWIELRAWWAALWGGKRDYGVAAEETIEIQIPLPPFSSYADPFASGQAGRMSPQELVRYSFEAFEAWSREHGCQREPEQTPHELARDVAKLNSFITSEARAIAELYARAAYSQGDLPANAAGRLRQLWQKMQMRTAAGGEGLGVTG